MLLVCCIRNILFPSDFKALQVIFSPQLLGKETGLQLQMGIWNPERTDLLLVQGDTESKFLNREESIVEVSFRTPESLMESHYFPCSFSAV